MYKVKDKYDASSSTRMEYKEEGNVIPHCDLHKILSIELALGIQFTQVSSQSQKWGWRESSPQPSVSKTDALPLCNAHHNIKEQINTKRYYVCHYYLLFLSI